VKVNQTFFMELFYKVSIKKVELIL